MAVIISRRSSYCPNFATAPQNTVFFPSAPENRDYLRRGGTCPLPDFSGPSLMEEGEKISLADFEGEVVVLNAWGQGCAPCPR